MPDGARKARCSWTTTVSRALASSLLQTNEENFPVSALGLEAVLRAHTALGFTPFSEVLIELVRHWSTVRPRGPRSRTPGSTAARGSPAQFLGRRGQQISREVARRTSISPVALGEGCFLPRSLLGTGAGRHSQRTGKTSKCTGSRDPVSNGADVRMVRHSSTAAPGLPTTTQ